MRANWVTVQYDFTAPVDRVFAYLSEHENLADLFGATVERLEDGQSERNGVGSRRRLKVGPGARPFEETVTRFVPGELIEYRITKGSPLRDHVGIMRFSSTSAGGTHLDYRIRIASRIPGLSPIVTAVLTRNVTKGLATVEARA
ncbi:MAG: SRPBCC family protein [Thermoleophilaceae bacterium]|nr:SRPBCC family protein [Thermoleophilaceae bacterium]